MPLTPAVLCCFTTFIRDVAVTLLHTLMLATRHYAMLLTMLRAIIVFDVDIFHIRHDVDIADDCAITTMPCQPLADMLPTPAADTPARLCLIFRFTTLHALSCYAR